jgi:hypothetical protein
MMNKLVTDNQKKLLMLAVTGNLTGKLLQIGYSYCLNISSRNAYTPSNQNTTLLENSKLTI